jgi:hypothetical protein
MLHAISELAHRVVSLRRNNLTAMEGQADQSLKSPKRRN